MTLSIRDIQQGLRYGQFSAVELARQTLARIERDNPQVNAFTDITAERMLREAAAIDERLRQGETLPPLAGVPFAVKTCLILRA